MTRVAPSQGARGGGPQGQRGQAQQQAQQQPTTFTTNTDDQGKFQFKDVEDGPYRIVAARNGFARMEYGQRTFNRPGTVINIRAGQPVTDISFRLSPASTISGRVLDSLGEPQPGVTVQALRSTYDATGKRTLQPAGSARTNDLGEYRIYWINPGRYVVSANGSRSALDLITSGAAQAAAQAQDQAQVQQAAQLSSMFGGGANPNEVADSGFGLTYYPGTTEASRALGLDLQPGAEMRGVDFTVIRTQRVRITGRVIDTATGRPPEEAAVSVARRDATASSPFDALLGLADPSGGNRYEPATGEFVVANVASGSYWLQVFAQGQAAPRPAVPDAPPTTQEALNMLSSINTARMPVEVLGSDITNLTLNVGPGTPVTGRVQIEGAQPANSADLQRIGVQLQSTTGGGNIFAMTQGSVVRVAADGTFSIPRLTAGDYTLVVSGLGPNLYVKSARLGQTDALNGVTISEPLNGSLEIALRPNPGQVSGNVVDATLKPIGGVQAVLVPDQARGRQDLYKTAVTDQDGRFTFRGVTPGDYRIFAWEDIEPFAYFDPAVVKQYEAAGKPVRVQESSSESAEVRLIPAATP
jgi:protocatechuate 3,4-dioxygenase beta subunit